VILTETQQSLLLRIAKSGPTCQTTLSAEEKRTAQALLRKGKVIRIASETHIHFSALLPAKNPADAGIKAFAQAFHAAKASPW